MAACDLEKSFSIDATFDIIAAYTVFDSCTKYLSQHTVQFSR